MEKIENALEISDDEERSATLNEGKDILVQRNKHIKLAEKYGWETVDCYVEEPLASDSDDDKKIRRAIKESKAMKEEKRKSARTVVKPQSVQSRLGSPASSQRNLNDVNFRQNLSSAQGAPLVWMPHVFVAVEEDTSPAFVDRLSQTTNQVVLSPTSEDDCLNSLVSNVNNVDILDKEFELSHFVYVTPKQPGSGVKGRLKENIVFWEKIKASSWVLRVIREGYALPFVETPEKRLHKNHRSAVICEDFVKSEITNLLKSGCIKEVLSDNVYIVSPLSVASNNGKKRLILDLRYLNGFLRVQRFQYEDLRTFRDIFSQGDWFFKFDYKSGYHHVDIYPEHWKYLAFCWGTGQSKRYFVFTVLPFGLATAPFVFTKIQKALLKHWRGQGIRIFTYLDDGVGGHSSRQEAKLISQTVRNDIDQSGFVWHPEKSCWDPTKCDEVLGFIVNLAEGYFRVPERRITKLNALLNNITTNNYKITAHDIARLTGTVISMGRALGPIARLWTRGLYRNLMSTASWSETVQLSDEAIKEIRFWSSSFEECHGQKIWLSDPQPQILSYSDASDSGWGGYCVQIKDQVAMGTWTPDEAIQSSTWRELRGTHMVLSSFAPQLQGKEVRHRTDNKNVESVLQIGSSSKLIHDEVLAIFKLCRK